MRQCVLICPDCGDSVIFSLGEDRDTQVTFNSKCGTQVRCLVDSTRSNERDRIRDLKERAKNG
jgi:hypothetical protein